MPCSERERLDQFDSRLTAENLTLTAGTGDITFTGAVGATRLGAVLINSATNVTESAGITAASLTQLAGTGTTTLNGTVNTDTAQGVQLTGVHLVVNAGVTTTGNGVVTVNETGTVTVASAGDIDADGAVVLTAGGGISTAGDVTTTNDNITFASATTLTGSIQIDTGNGAGNVLFQSTLSGTTAGAENLTLAAGGGDITFTGAVGATRLGDILINNAANVTETAGVTASSLTQLAGSGTTTLNGAVNTNAIQGVQLTGTNLVVNAGITTTANGVVAVNESGTAVFAAAGDINADGAVSLAAVSGISTAGDITTTNDNVSFVSATTLTGSVQIDTGAGAGNVAFQSTLTGTTAGTEDLTLTAGSGNITFTGAVGSTRLGAILINSAANVTESAGLTAASLTQMAGSGTTTLNGAVNTNTIQGVQLTGTNLVVNAGITTAGSGVVIINESNTVNIASVGDISSDGAVSITAAGGISTAGDVSTTNDNVTFASATTLTGSVQIDTGNGAGNVAFQSSLTGTTSGNQNLTLTAGSGDITFTGAVGATRLGAVLINSAANVTESAGITASSLTQLAGTGTTTLNGAVNTNAVQGVQLTGTNLVINAGITTTGNGVVTVHESNTAVIAASGDIVADGAVSLTASGGITTAGDVTTSSDAVTFVSATRLTGSVQIDTGADTGNVTFQSSLTGTTAGAEDLTVTAGTGNVMFAGNVGATRLGAVLINSATDVTESAGLTAASLTQLAGTGITTLNGAVNTNTIQGVQLTGTNLAVNAGITTTGSGVVTMTESSSIVIAAAGDINADGAVTLTASGGIATAGDVTTTSDNVTFASATTLTGSVQVNTGAGAGHVTFQSTLQGTTAEAENLTLTAGTGNVTFTGAVGATRLGAVLINSATNVTENGGMTVASLTQLAGTGTTTLNGAVNTSTVQGVQLTGTNLEVHGGITTTGNGVVTVSESNTVVIAATGDIHADGAVSLTAGSGIATAGDIATTNDNVTFVSAMTLTGSVQINTGAGAGNVTFQNVLTGTTSGTEDLSLTAGAGNITFTGVVGATQLGAIVINSAANVTESAGLTATSLVQVAGTGTTAFNGAVATTDSAGIQLTTSMIVVNAPVTTTGSGVVTFTNAGLLTINGDIMADGAVTQNGAGLVTITEPRSLSTTGDAISFATGVTLTGSGSTLAIDTTVGGNAAGANVTFFNSVGGATSGVDAESLTVNAGTAGDVVFVGPVASLGTLTITNSGNTAFQGTLQANHVLVTDTTDTVAFQADTTLSTLTTTNQPYHITFGKAGGPVATDTITGLVNFLNTGTVTLGLNAGDSVTFQNGMIHTVGQTDITGTLTSVAGSISLGSTALDGTVRTTGQQVTVQALTLTGAGEFNTSFGSPAGANVTFGSTIDATSAGVENLTVNAGAGGNILFSGAVGTGTRLGDLVVTNAHNATFQGGIVAASLTQTAGTGTTTLNGTTNTNTATGIDLTSNVIVINNTLTATGSGGIQFTNAGLLTINANISSDGAISQDGAGLVTITSPVGGTRSITTTGDSVSFLRGVTELGSGGQLSIDTTASGHATGANVTFSGTLNATNVGPTAEGLLINAGTAGDVVFTGAVGAATRLGSVVISNAHNVTETSGITAASLTQTTGTGQTTLNGAVDTNAAAGISLTNGAITVNNTATATNQIALKAINPNGNINLNSTIQTTQGTGLVSLTAVHGGVTNGAAANVVNVISNSLVVQTTQGIGSANALQTRVANFAAHNTGTGNIRVDNVTGQLLTINSVAGVNGITNNGSSAGNIAITNNGSILVSPASSATNAPITNATGGDISLLTKGGAFDITVNSPVSALNGSGNITLSAGHNVVIHDTGVTNDISLTGTGTVSLTAANTVILGSMDPNATPDTIQHTVQNDVVIMTGTGSITNTLPLIYNIQAPQVSATGEVVLSGDFGRPGEHNFTITVYWGDGTSTTQVFADPGHFTFTHTYHGNPNPDDQSAPILINVQVAHDSHVVLKALNVNTMTESVPDIGVDPSPPVPSPNINSDLSNAIYNPADTNYAALHPKVLTANGNVDNPGTVVYQDISVRATAVPVPGEGLASFPYDVTPPVVYLHFPEQVAAIDLVGTAASPISQGDTARLDITSGEEGVATERLVFLEIVRADGSVERVPLGEEVLDDLMKLISELPDGKYRFQLQEPGESRQRLLLDLFEVRQGKIVSESDDGDRPPSSNGRQQRMSPADLDEPADAEDAIRNGALSAASAADSTIEFADRIDVDEIAELRVAPATGSTVEATLEMGWNGWTSMAGRGAWKRAQRITDSFVEESMDARTGDRSADVSADLQASGSSEELGTSDIDEAGSILLVGATVAGLPVQKSTREFVGHAVSAGLNRASRLFRKIGAKSK